MGRSISNVAQRLELRHCVTGRIGAIHFFRLERQTIRRTEDFKDFLATQGATTTPTEVGGGGATQRCDGNLQKADGSRTVCRSSRAYRKSSGIGTDKRRASSQRPSRS